MPQIPFDPNPTVSPVGATGAFLSVERNPAAFGATVAGAEQGLGATLDQGGSEFAQTAMKFQEEHNESAVDNANTTYDSNVRAAVGQFRELRGADAMNARAGVLAQIEQARQDVRGTLQNPEQQRMYDYMSRQNSRRYLDEVEFHAASESKVWQGETANGAIQNEKNNIATYWSDNNLFAQGIGSIKIQTTKLLNLMGVDPDSDAGKARIAHEVGDAWTARLNSVKALDPDFARQLFDANADQIDANHRAMLDQSITSAQYMRMMRDESQARQADASARRDLETTQATNLASLTADVLSGKSVNWGQLADQVRTQQVAPHVPEFLMSLQNRRGAGAETDRADAVIALHKTLNDPTVSVDDRMAAISSAARSRSITASTAGTLVDAAFRGNTKVESQTAKEARASVLAAAGVPDGLINIGHEDAARKAQVEVEWTNRVTNGNEDPLTVRDDMIPRYMPSGLPPSTWPIPKYGTIASSADVPKVAAATKAAFDTGKITAAQYQTEKANIVNYSGFYQRLDQSRAAAASVAAQQSPGGAKAKLRGQVPATQQ